MFHTQLSIDESMVPYYGCHSCKQFIRGKPIRFGYKMWVLASASGLPYNISIYEGKADGPSVGPLGTRVIKEALSICKYPDTYHVIFDNFYTSSGLMNEMTELGFHVTGTIRDNRTMPCDEYERNEEREGR